MAVTVSYAFTVGASLPILNLDGEDQYLDFELTGLANGAIASAGIHTAGGAHVDVAVWDDPKLNGEPARNGPFTGSETSIDQLSGPVGNLVLASTNAGEIYYTVVAQGGGQVTAPTGLGQTNITQPDVAAFAGDGFVMVGKKHFGSGTDNDIYVYVRNANGSERHVPFTPDSSTADDESPSVCAIGDGGFALAWHRDDGVGNTEIWYQVYNADGSSRSIPLIFDTDGPVNRDASIVGVGGGNFAIAYEESVGSREEIAFALFGPSGAPLGKIDLDAGPENPPPALDVKAPHATLLSNGLVAVTAAYTTDAADSKAAVQLVDTESMTALFDAFQVVSSGSNDFPATGAGFGDAGLAIGWESNGSFSDGRKLQLVRTTTGAGADNNLTGDDAVDVMSGGGGFDKLRGFDNNDSLNGGGDQDTMLGGQGNDTLDGGGDIDTLSGAQGKDSLRFLSIGDSVVGAADLIVGLEDKDKIDLSSIDANINKGGDQRFQLVAALDGHAAEAVLTYNASGTYAGLTTLGLDVNGDALADGLILIAGDHSDFTHFVF